MLLSKIIKLVCNPELIRMTLLDEALGGGLVPCHCMLNEVLRGLIDHWVLKVQLLGCFDIVKLNRLHHLHCCLLRYDHHISLRGHLWRVSWSMSPFQYGIAEVHELSLRDQSFIARLNSDRRNWHSAGLNLTHPRSRNQWHMSVKGVEAAADSVWRELWKLPSNPAIPLSHY